MNKKSQNQKLLLHLAIILLLLVPHAVFAKKTVPSSAPKYIVRNITSQFKARKNNIGRVSMTEFTPLSLNIPENNSISYIGVSFLMQKDVVLSTGVGAAFNF